MKAVGQRGGLCCVADAFRLGVVCFCWCAMWAGRVAEGTKIVEHSCYTGLDPATATIMTMSTAMSTAMTMIMGKKPINRT